MKQGLGEEPRQPRGNETYSQFEMRRERWRDLKTCLAEVEQRYNQHTLEIADLNTARQIARVIQTFAEANRVPGANAIYATESGAKEITDAAVRIEALLADVVQRLRGES